MRKLQASATSYIKSFKNIYYAIFFVYITDPQIKRFLTNKIAIKHMKLMKIAL